ncbi:MFS transporter [Actinomadura spongiicola]|uniref:MFS transporter n=1 Tax=Actinomadura spongiicola TaxID=2303421 RepID=UPI003899061E
MTDRFGGRVMFPLLSLITIVPVLYLGLWGHSTLAALLVGGFFLGVGGTTFAVGVPFVNAWFPPERRGFAVGVFGAGMGGTAISAGIRGRGLDGVARDPRPDTPAPIGYLTRPYIVYRSRDEQLGMQHPPRGWDRVP